MNAVDKQLHGAYGDSVIPKPLQLDGPDGDEKAHAGQGSRPNVQIYLQEIRKPDNSLKLRRQGCAGWPCHDGYLCDFCLLRPEWAAQAKIGPMQEEIDDLRHTIVGLRKQQADVDTLKKAERLVTGKYWSAMEDNRLGNLNSLLQDSKARLEAEEAVRGKIAAETAQASLLEQLTNMQEKLEQKERDVSTARQKTEALSESLTETQRELKFVTGELDQKRMMIADAIKEKGRAGHEVMRLKTLLSAQESELLVRGEQVKALIVELQKLQQLEREKEAFKLLAEQRASLALGVMDQVAEDIVLAERTRDEHAQAVRRLTKEQALTKKSMISQNNTMARLRTELAEAKTSLHHWMEHDSAVPFGTLPATTSTSSVKLPAAPGRSSPMQQAARHSPMPRAHAHAAAHAHHAHEAHDGAAGGQHHSVKKRLPSND
eukprot:CAMPEP_0181313566 /NCGR_PEP_ID=MMETSP1101-20121128/14315_1 /TAXON_ID=46948 /ORGANISM="Rhodomonas abbreviata, Strain Caron Lab Isolate" /LENGTH=430 /DNA_ID=CAMNT_0023420525 /DNA_START=513 /DNA_END=1805 /DNA_ORIENTATION=-